MLKLFNKKKKDNKGFTLVELVVVIAILAILVGLLAPQYTKYVEKARKSSDASNLENMVRAVEVAIADTNEDTRVQNGTYKIAITDAGASVIKNPVAGGSATPSAATSPEYKAINEVISDWTSTKLKSKNWVTSETETNEISATIIVQKDGSFSVSYKPDDLAKMTETYKANNNG